MKALQKRPADRFQSAQEFLSALPDFEPVRREVSSPSPAGAAREKAGPGAAPNDASADAPTHKPEESSKARFVQAEVAKVRPDRETGSPRSKLMIGVGAAAVLAVGAVTWSLLDRTKPSAPPSSVTARGPGSVSGGPVILPPAEAPVEPSPKLERIPTIKKGTPPANHAESGKDKGVQPSVPEPGAKARVDPGSIAPASQDLSGMGQGVYTDSSSPQDRTGVTMRMQEEQGGLMTGTLSFEKADHASGSCSLGNSAYYADRKKLKILPHCSDPAIVPKYFNTPTWLAVADPSDKALSGPRISLQTDRRPVPVRIPGQRRCVQAG